MLHRGHFKYLPAVLAAAIWVSCSQERILSTESPSPSPVEDDQAVMTVLLPSHGQPKTYAVDDIDDNRVDNIDLLMFRQTTGDDEFQYRSRGVAITDLNPQGSIKRFRAKVANSEPGDSMRIVLIANASTLLDAMTLVKGTSKTSLLSQLEFAAPKWAAANSSAFTPLPMWGEAEPYVVITSATNTFPTVEMMRAVARVDVGINFPNLSSPPAGLSNFELTGVYVYNMQTKGKVVPNTANLSGNIAHTPTLQAVPAVNPMYSYGPGDITNQNSLVRTIYVAESLAGSATTRATAPCLVIAGKHNGSPTETYYRLDFLKSAEPHELDDEFLPILRNYRYVFNITQVDNAGYPTLADAFNSLPVNGMGVRVTFYDVNIASLTYDSGYMLGLSHYELKLKYDAYPSVKIKAFSDHPIPWQASIDNTLYPWVRIISGATGGGPNVYTDIELEVDANALLVDRVGFMDITFSGRLVERVRIIQTDEIEVDGSTEVIPGEVVEVDNPDMTGMYLITLQNNYGWSWSGYDMYMRDPTTSNFNLAWGLPSEMSTYSNVYEGRNWYNYYQVIIVTSLNGTPLPTSLVNGATLTIDPADQSWLSFWEPLTIQSTGYNSAWVGYHFRYYYTPYPNYTDLNNPPRVGTMYFTFGDIKKILTFTQDLAYCEIPENFTYYDTRTFTHRTVPETILVATEDIMSNSINWYTIANVANGNNDPDIYANQVVPARSFSCARLNELNYLGYATGWRLPTKDEANHIGYFAMYGRDNPNSVESRDLMYTIQSNYSNRYFITSETDYYSDRYVRIQNFYWGGYGSGNTDEAVLKSYNNYNYNQYLARCVRTQGIDFYDAGQLSVGLSMFGSFNYAVYTKHGVQPTVGQDGNYANVVSNITITNSGTTTVDGYTKWDIVITPATTWTGGLVSTVITLTSTDGTKQNILKVTQDQRTYLPAAVTGLADDLLVASEDQTANLSWYVYANVPDNTDTSDTPPAGPQVNPPRANSCAALNTYGLTSWRLPTLDEAGKMYTYFYGVSPTFYAELGLTTNYYWTATPYSSNYYAYLRTFSSNYSTTSDKPNQWNNYRARCVRTVYTEFYTSSGVGITLVDGVTTNYVVWTSHGVQPTVGQDAAYSSMVSNIAITNTGVTDLGLTAWNIAITPVTTITGVFTVITLTSTDGTKNNTFTLGNSRYLPASATGLANNLLLASSDQPTGQSWYVYANVASGTNTSDEPPAGPQESPALTNSCAAATYDGYATNWRLPTRTELQAILNRLGTTAWSQFGFAQSYYYWTATPYSSMDNYAYNWCVTTSPWDNYSTKSTTSASYRARCVRTIP